MEKVFLERGSERSSFRKFGAIYEIFKTDENYKKTIFAKIYKLIF